MTQQFAKVLTNYIPSTLSVEVITLETDLILFNLELIKEDSLNVDKINPVWPAYTPEENLIRAYNEELSIISWHRDAHEGYYPRRIVVWANKIPPLIMNSDYSEELICKDNDMILIYNREAYHCMNPICKHCSDRWSRVVWLKD